MKLLISLSLTTVMMAQSLATVEVVAKPVDRFVRLTAEILPFQSTPVVARIAGYLDSIEVDRGSVVRKGEVLARITAPEWAAQVAEAKARVATIEAQKGEARSRIRAAESTASRLRKASETVGAVAANEVIQADEVVKAGQAALAALERSSEAAGQQVVALEELSAFLSVRAPFDGVVTERMQHSGALVGPTAGPLFRVEQLNRLRVVVAIPEANVSTVRTGQQISFSVSALPGESFMGRVSRVSRILDPQTRTMPVEVDVANPAGKLAPGMYTEVKWPAKSGQTTLLVPAIAIATTTERSFVIRVESGKARYVDIRRGAAEGALVEVFGPLAAGDRIVERATDEIREGSPIPLR